MSKEKVHYLGIGNEAMCGRESKNLTKDFNKVTCKACIKTATGTPTR